jgi:nucleotide-binding universal stress UspA family protein
MKRLRTILVPTDFSDCSRQAFHLAAMLARDQHARLVVLHVNPEVDPLEVCRQPIDFREQLRHRLDEFRLPESHVPVEHRLVDGEPSPEILKLAEEIGCDLIVMGSHGRRGLGRLVLGSVAEQVLRHAHCPVVTIRERAAKSLTSEAAAVVPAG